MSLRTRIFRSAWAQWPWLLAVAFAMLVFSSCSDSRRKDSEGNQGEIPPVLLDYDRIVQNGKLIVLTENTSTSYYLFRGQAMGYDYELLSAFCKDHGLEIEIVVIDDLNEMFEMLRMGKGDIIACNLTMTAERLRRVDFTVPLCETRQVLVQRKPEDWRSMSRKSLRDSLIQSPFELVGHEVHVHAYSSYNDRLENLQEEIGGEIQIEHAPGDIDSEELIRMVARGEIDFTLADDNVALLNQSYYPELDVKLELSLPQRIAWAVRPNSDSLLHELNTWILDKKNARRIAYTYDKYFKSVKSQKERVLSEYSSFNGQRISEFDDKLLAEAERIGWDWRLLAAVCYQESRFNPEARSWAGAYGLMQLMPATGARYGIDTTMTREANIEAGVKFLSYLDKFWEKRVPDPIERKKFVLASYNCGHGHVLDASALAAELGYDSGRWDLNVEKTLRLKSNPRYYSMNVVKHGYCRGDDASNYVRDVLAQYKHYKSQIDL